MPKTHLWGPPSPSAPSQAPFSHFCLSCCRTLSLRPPQNPRSSCPSTSASSPRSPWRKSSRWAQEEAPKTVLTGGHQGQVQMWATSASVLCAQEGHSVWPQEQRQMGDQGHRHLGRGGRNVGNDESGSRLALMLLCVLGLVARPLCFVLFFFLFLCGVPKAEDAGRGSSMGGSGESSSGAAGRKEKEGRRK